MSFIFSRIKRALAFGADSSDSEDSQHKYPKLDHSFMEDDLPKEDEMHVEKPFTDEEMETFLAEYKIRCDKAATSLTRKGRRMVGLRHNEKITYYIRFIKAGAKGDRCAGIPNFECNAKPLTDPTQHWQRDHIIPLEGGFGGTNHIDNLQDLCVNCHAEKSKREAPTRNMRFEIVGHRLREFQVRWLDFPDLELEWLTFDRFTTKSDMQKLGVYMATNLK